MKNITDLRQVLFETMEGVKNGTIDPEKAKVVSELGQVIVNTVKVEVDFIGKQGGGNGSGFVPIMTDTETPKKLERPKAEYSNTGHIQVRKKYA